MSMETNSTVSAPETAPQPGRSLAPGKVLGFLLLWVALPLLLGILLASWLIKPAAVGVIHLEYDIYSESVAFVMDQVEELDNYPNIKAVVILIDSPGGEVVASQNLYLELLKLRSKMPVVASINSLAASGAYYTAIAADLIYARPSSTVGNVGAWSYVPSEYGVNDLILATGPFKLTATNREAFARELEGIKLEFLATVAASRGDRLKISLTDLSTGLAYPGRRALELGLVDFIGGPSDAIEKAAGLAHIAHYDVIDLQDIVIAKYRAQQAADEGEGDAQGAAVKPSLAWQASPWIGAADPLSGERTLPPGIYLLYDVRLRRGK